MEIVDNFRADLRRGRSIVLVGAGVSYAASSDPKSTWHGLLTSGIGFAQASRKLDEDTADLFRGVLDEGATSDDYLDIADELVASLGGKESGDFLEWLVRDVGNLRIQDDRVLQAILNLNLPIITTNYDRLLEQAGNRDYVTWTRSPLFQQVVAGTSNAIGHLHGYYTDPPSIVLTRDSYSLFLRDEYVQALRHAMSAINIVVYVGFGEGISDPNFSSLRAWVQDTMPTQSLKHYRLCRQSELERLQDEHRNEIIVPVPYGSEYTDLGAFLESVETPGSVETAFDPTGVLRTLEEQLRSESIVKANGASLREARLNDLLVPPALIPVSHEQYVAARQEKNGTKPQRCDLQEELGRDRILIVGDEKSGLSSALMWFSAQHHLRDASLIPIVIDHRAMVTGSRSLDTTIRQQLRQLGYSINDKAALPRIVLTIDNIGLGDRSRLRRLAKDLSRGFFEVVILGCRSGADNELQVLLADEGLKFHIRHMGKLTRKDVADLAALADGVRAKELATRAIEVVQHQHLPNTPFTFAMIISALVKGDSLLTATSQTALLDSYVNLLMGRGRQDEDSRVEMDSFNRSYVIEKLAEVFVREKKGSLPADLVVATVSESFTALEWPDNPLETVLDLADRNLLRIKSQNVSFAQSSYLHLFAAKRSLRSASLNRVLRDDPLYYAPILGHYAALRRDDTELLIEVSSLLGEFSQEEIEPTSVFAVRSSDEGEDRSIDTAVTKVERTVAAIGSDDGEEPEIDDQLYSDLEPFPLQPIDDAPLAGRMAITLDLVSSILRDTEIMEDVNVRREILGKVLLGWANFVRTLESDEYFGRITTENSRDLAKDLGIPEKRWEEFTSNLRDLTAIFIAFSGMSATVRSRKMSRSLEHIFEDKEFLNHPGRAAMGSILAYDIAEPGWSKIFLKMSAEHGHTAVVDLLLQHLAKFALTRFVLTDEDRVNLINFLVGRVVAYAGAATPDELSRVRSQIERSVLTARMTSEGRHVPLGVGILDDDLSSEA